MLTRRAALLSVAAAAVLLAAPAPVRATDDLKLPRQKIELVAPPFVHAHEQATKQSPKIVEFTMTIEEKKIVIDDKGTTFQAMTFNGSMPGPMMVVHEGDYVELTLVNPVTNSMPQYRLPLRDRRGRRRRADAGQSGRTGDVALEGDTDRHLRLSLRTRRTDDPVARGIRHVRRGNGAAARGADRRQGQAGQV